LWAERFDRDLTDIFAVQDDVTTRIVSALELNLSRGDQQKISIDHIENMEAYDCFLRGRELWYRSAKEPNVRAQAMLTRAVELDPNFARAYAFLAIVHVRDYLNGWSASPMLSLEQGHQMARRAVALNDRDPYAHWALGGIYLWLRRHDEAISGLKQAISLNPNFALGYGLLGLSLHYAGLSEQALECFDRAIALDPYTDQFLHFKAQACFQLGKYDNAIDLLRSRITRNPDTDISRVLLAASYGQMGLVEEAGVAWRHALRVNPDYSLDHRRTVLPYKDPSDFDRVAEGLHKAGLTD
jgi:adenylate cyclase